MSMGSPRCAAFASAVYMGCTVERTMTMHCLLRNRMRGFEFYKSYVSMGREVSCLSLCLLVPVYLSK